MKLFIIQCVLFLTEMVLIFVDRTHMWIPAVLMIIPVVLLFSIAYNWPIIGLYAAKFEHGSKLFPLYFVDKFKIDSYITATGDDTFRVLHQRLHRKKQHYKTWVVPVKK